MHCKASGGYYGPEPQRLPERKHLSCLSCLSCMWCFDCLVRLGSVQHPGIEPIQHSAGAFPVGQCRIYRRTDIKRSRRNAGVCLVILRCSLRVRYCVRSRLRKTSWIVPLIVISGVLCAALSLCCDDWAEETFPPIWLRSAEAVGCGLALAVVMGLLYFGTDLLPTRMSPWVLGLPPVLGLLVGGWVPHIYRSAHRAAMLERSNACELSTLQPKVKSPVASPPTLAAA
jgi:hypothetical protein